MRKYFFKFKLAVMSLSILAFLSFPALAENYTFPGASGLYATANIGFAEYDYDTTGWTDVDDSDTAYSVGFGYEFNKYIAVEAGWLDIGKTSASASGTLTGTLYGKPYTATGTLTGEAETDGFYLGPIVSLPITEKFKAYAKIGVYFWDTDIEASASGTITYDGTIYAGNAKVQQSESGEDLYFGIGASYDIINNFTVRADWTRYEVMNDDVDVFAVGVVFKFGKLF